MANESIIRRIIRLVLDDRSAKQTQDEARGVAENVENAWKGAASKIAQYLGAAFLIKSIVDFGRAAVAAANEEESALNGLRVAVENAGASWTDMEGKIRASAAAMMDATTVGDDQYYESLQRLIDLTGDVGASTQNMGLVANVAAQFFNGELGPAADLVGKVMNGNVTVLQRMGIQAGSAQEALELLAGRSMGAAEARAKTFSGQMEQLHNVWGEFLEDVGRSITEGEAGATVFETLRAAIATMSDWVVRNKEEIQDWILRGVNFAIDAADVLYRAIVGVSQVISGGFTTALGLGAKGLGLLARGFALVEDANARLKEFMGNEEEAKRHRENAERIREQAAAINDWADAAINAGSDRVGKGLERLATPVFSSKDFSPGSRTGRAAPPAGGVGSGRPSTAAGAKTEADKALEKAMDDFVRAGERIGVMQDVLGDKFNANEAELKRITDLMVAMRENGVDPASESFLALQRQAEFLNASTDPLNQTLAEMGQRLREDATIAAMTGVESFDMLRSQQGELEKAMRSLIQQGMDPQDERLKALADRYADVTHQIEAQTTAMQIQAGAAGFLGEAVGMAMEGGIGPAAAAKSRQNRIEGMEMLVRAAGFALFGNPVGAGAALRQAASHFALAAAWGALASSSRGAGSASTATPSVSAASGSAGTGITTARNTSSRSTSQSRTPTPEVSLYLVGPGFDALNPTVQKVVWGATKNAEERYGNNATVRTVRQ